MQNQGKKIAGGPPPPSPHLPPRHCPHVHNCWCLRVFQSVEGNVAEQEHGRQGARQAGRLGLPGVGQVHEYVAIYEGGGGRIKCTLPWYKFNHIYNRIHNILSEQINIVTKVLEPI